MSLVPTPTAQPTARPLKLLGELPQTELSGDTGSALQAVLDQLVRGGAPDAIGAVITADGMWAGAAGIDGPDDRAARATDEFGIASVTKVFFAALVFKLAEQGKIDLDAPLADYLSGIDVNSNGATVRDALAMRSGIGATPEGAITKALAECDTPWNLSEVIDTFPAPFGPPGAEYSYSNPTYKLLGYAAENASGLALPQAFRQELLDPVGADRIVFQDETSGPPKPWAVPTAGHGEELELSRYGEGGTLPCVGFSSFGSASAIASDAPSLARWAWELFAGRVIGAQSLAEMAQLTDGEHGHGIDRLPAFGDMAAWGHSGSMAGYSALLVISPKIETVAVLFVNDSDFPLNDGMQQLLGELQPSA